jgi:hypothetical protein
MALRPKFCLCGTEYTCKIACICDGYPHDPDCHYGQGWDMVEPGDTVAVRTCRGVYTVLAIASTGHVFIKGPGMANAVSYHPDSLVLLKKASRTGDLP